MAREAFAFSFPFSVGFERLDMDRPELVCAFACSSAVTSFVNGIVQQPNLEFGELFAHAFCPSPFESAADSAAFPGLRGRWGVGFL